MSYPFIVTWNAGTHRDIIGDADGYATLTDAQITAKEFFEPENEDDYGVTEIWENGEIVETYTPPGWE